MLSRRKLLGTTLGAATSFYACAGRDPALAQPNRRPKQLVLVHGRNQQGSATEIKAEWVAALRAGARKIGRDLPGDVNIDMAYYGDALDRFAKQLDVPVASDIKARGNPGDNELLVFQAQIAEQLRVKAKITDDQVNAEYGPSDKPRGPLNWEWVQAILRALDKYGPGVSKRTIETFTRDVFLYVTRSTVQDEIDRIVAAHLTDAPMVIVGHSLGSVVAYHVLRNDHRALDVPLFVTLGSPLAIRAVREQFIPLRNPAPPIGAWFNAFDPRDTIALFPLDQDNFPVTPAIENYGGVNNETDNRHGVSGYLDDPEVARKILDALTG